MTFFYCSQVLLLICSLLSPFALAAPIDAATQTETEAETFDAKLEAAALPEFRLLNLLAHPDHSILPEQTSFHNKTALILAIGKFAASIPASPLHDQFVEKWVAKGGEQKEAENLFGAIDGMLKGAEIGEEDGLRTTLMGLYAIGGRILSDTLEDKDALKGDDDDVFVFGLKKAFTKVERVLAGLDQTEQMTVTNAELLDKVAGIGNKLEEKFGKQADEEGIKLMAILEGAPGADKLIGQLIAQSVDERMAEVADPDGGWGYVKKDDEEENVEAEEEEKVTPKEKNEAEAKNEAEGETEEKNEEANEKEVKGELEEEVEKQSKTEAGSNAKVKVEEAKVEEDGKKNNELKDANAEGQNQNPAEEAGKTEMKEEMDVEGKAKNEEEKEMEEPKEEEQNHEENEEKKETENEIEETEAKDAEAKENKQEDDKEEANSDEEAGSEEEVEEEVKKEKKDLEDKLEDAEEEAKEGKADGKEETPEVKENEAKEDEQELQMNETKGNDQKKGEESSKDKKFATPVEKIVANAIDAVEKEDI